jgi:hypothetical protein
MSGPSLTQPPQRAPAPSAPPPPTGWRRWLWPLRSRKVQVALATVIVAYAAEAGIVLTEETTATVLGRRGADTRHRDRGWRCAARMRQ